MTGKGRGVRDDATSVVRLPPTQYQFSLTPHPSPLTWRTHLLVLGGFLLLTLVFTYPIMLHFTSEIPFGGDAWQHIWNLWWIRHALLDLGTNPYHTDLLFYPDGANLYFHTLALTAGLTGIPLQLLGLNLIETYNLIMVSSFLLAGYGAFLLCHYLTRNVWASLVGGFVFAFSPYHFAHLIGHMNLSSLQWIPFYVLLLLRAVDEPRRDGPHPYRRGLLFAVGAGALLAVNTYTDWLYGIFLVLFTAMLLAWRLVVPAGKSKVESPMSNRKSKVESPMSNVNTPPPGTLDFGPSTFDLEVGPSTFDLEVGPLDVGLSTFDLRAGVSWVDGGLRLVAGSVVFLLLVAPVLVPTLREAQKGYAQQPPLETLVYSADLSQAFVPSALHPLWGTFVSDHLRIHNRSEQVLFLGFTTLALAGFAAWKLRRNRRVLFWAFAGLATWVLSLGPVLQAFGRSRFTDFDVAIPLPYLLLYKLPLLNIMRTPARLTVLTMLALGVLVAFGLDYLSSNQLPVTSYQLPVTSNQSRVKGQGSRVKGQGSRVTGYWLLVGLPLLIGFEYLAVPFPTVPPGWGVPIYSKIAGEPGQFALLELPIRPFSDYMAYQTIHGKPIVGGYLSRQPPYPTLERTPALTYLVNTTHPDDPIKSQVASGRGVAALRELGIKYVIIHWWAFTAEEKAGMERKLGTLLGRRADFTYPSDQVDVWQIAR